MGSYSSENAKIFNARGSSYPFSSPYVNRISYPGGRSEGDYPQHSRRSGINQSPVDVRRDRYFRTIAPDNFRPGGAFNIPIPMLDIDLRHRVPDRMDMRGSFEANRSFDQPVNHASRSFDFSHGQQESYQQQQQQQQSLFKAPMPWLLPFKQISVRESFDSASSAPINNAAAGSQSMRGSSDSLPAYMPSQRHHHDAELADIDFTRAPSYSSVQSSADRGHADRHFRIGSSVRSGVEYSVGESDASLLSRDTRNAHVHVHTLEKGVGGGGAAISTTKSHTIMFGGAGEPSPKREGLGLIAGPEPPSALEGLGKIFSRSSRGGDSQQWRHPGQQQHQQQTMNTVVHSRAVVQYESNGAVRDYEGSVAGSEDGSTARIGSVPSSSSSHFGISSNHPRGGVAMDPSPQTKRYERGLYAEGVDGEGVGMRFVENPRANQLENGTGYFTTHANDVGGAGGGGRADESRYVHSPNGVIYGQHRVESQTRGQVDARGSKVAYANFRYAQPGEDLGTRFSANAEIKSQNGPAAAGSREVSPYYRPGIRQSEYTMPSWYKDLNVLGTKASYHAAPPPATTYHRESGELFRDLRSTESKLITGSPPPKPAARSPRDTSPLPNHGHPNVTVTSPSVGSVYQPGYASRRVTYTVVRPEDDAKWEPVLTSIDAGSRFLMFTHDAIRDALSELITCTHKNRIKEAAEILDELCGVIEVHARQEDAASTERMAEADRIAIKAEHQADAEEVAGLRALFGSCLMGESQGNGLIDKVRSWAKNHEEHLEREEHAFRGEVSRRISGRRVVAVDLQGMEDKLLGQVLKRLDSCSPFKTVLACVKIVQESCTPAEFMRLQATMWKHLSPATMRSLEDEGALKAGKYVEEQNVPRDAADLLAVLPAGGHIA